MLWGWNCPDMLMTGPKCPLCGAKCPEAGWPCGCPTDPAAPDMAECGEMGVGSEGDLRGDAVMMGWGTFTEPVPGYSEPWEAVMGMVMGW
mmetsp:Transcript_101006/g.240712  ORF Transcript_101006/g.240712 Transcript_101006/m.240712 type:complete len:90 (+) Transcript_101006:129-398(+)